MLELRIKVGRRNMPIFDLPTALGRQRSAREIGDQIEAMIAFLDDLNGDPDLEDGNDAEADMSDHEPDDDALGDPSWPEWHARPHKVTAGGHEPGGLVLEDDEDDDPAEDDDPDTGVDDEGEAIDEREDGSWPEGHQGGVFRIADDEEEEDCPEVRAPHRSRIRRTRCDQIVRGGQAEYRLRHLSDGRLLTKLS